MSSNSISKRVFEILRDTHNDLKPCAQGLFGMLTEKDLDRAVDLALAAERKEAVGVAPGVAAKAVERNKTALASMTRLRTAKCFWCSNTPVPWDSSTYDGLCDSCSRELDARAKLKSEWLLSRNKESVQ